ncbi:polysaccharide deacetylase family protein [Stigmatella sp. ncwal1]|uniref:Polysaccharide deacetylase family protein n=1 Tax=Stigmatella ashevillensis TaxID=2995309 RepID=A0ABT5DI36_9BACT|nr:polysaccharide deacetylase family protein [Stigmatella ashevillena]MDC0713321.1 polysaccharide deacetylase family protein [Stigmatella ashevillena]
MSGNYKAILTFDDGPIDERGKDDSLKTILETLKARSVLGVFYVLGEEVKAKPALTQSIIVDGHIIQSHSWSHQRLSKLSEMALTQDLQKTQEAIASLTGKKPTRLRPPYGDGWVGEPKSKILIDVAAKLGLTLTGWDIDTNDWNSQNQGLNPNFFSPTKSSWKKLYEMKQSPLDILMHVKGVTARALGQFMDGLMREGWQFTTYPDDVAKPAAPSSSQAVLQYQIQLFAGSQDRALTKVQEAGSAGYTNVRIFRESGLYKVRVGPYGSHREADSVLGKLAPKFPGAFIVSVSK